MIIINGIAPGPDGGARGAVELSTSFLSFYIVEIERY